MATFVQQAGEGFGNSASARSKAFPSSVTAGSLLLVAVPTYNAGITVTITDTLLNTYLQIGDYVEEGDNRLSVWYCISRASGANTVTMTPSASAYSAIGIVEYSGVGAGPFEYSSTNHAASTTALSTGSVAVPNAGDLILACFGISDTQAFTPGSGFTLRVNQGVGIIQMAVFIEEKDGASTTNADGTLAGAADYVALGVSFRQVRREVADSVATLDDVPWAFEEQDEILIPAPPAPDPEPDTPPGEAVPTTHAPFIRRDPGTRRTPMPQRDDPRYEEKFDQWIEATISAGVSERLRGFTDQVSEPLNALMRAGVLTRTAIQPPTWEIRGGAGGVLSFNGESGVVEFTAADVFGLFDANEHQFLAGPVPVSFRTITLADLPFGGAAIENAVWYTSGGAMAQSPNFTYVDATTLLKIGNSGVTNSANSAVLVNRAITDTSLASLHTFADNTQLSGGDNAMGYNSFDARCNVTGTRNYDHINSFQNYPTYASTGTLGTHVGYWSQPTFSAGCGTVSVVAHFDAADPGGTGVISTQYGLLIGDLTRGATNYSIYTGTAQCRLGGDVTVIGTVTIANAAPTLVMTDTTGSAKSLTVVTNSNIVNFRESAGTKLLTLDLANSRVGVNTLSPTGDQEVIHEGGTATSYVTGYGGVGTPAQGVLFMRGARGTEASPTATQSTDPLGQVIFKGRGDTAFVGATAFRIVAEETFTDTAAGSGFRIDVTLNGTITTLTAVSFANTAVATFTRTIVCSTPSTAADTASLRLPAGTLMTTAVADSIENAGGILYWTVTGPTRLRFAFQTGAGTATRVPFYDANGYLVDDADMTFVTNTLTVTNLVAVTGLTNSALTSGRIPFMTTGGLFTSDASLLYAVGTQTITSANPILLLASTSIATAGVHWATNSTTRLRMSMVTGTADVEIYDAQNSARFLLFANGGNITASKPFIIALGTITTDKKALETTATWNDGAVTFIHIKHNVTATAKAAASLLEDFQVGGASKRKLDINGVPMHSGSKRITTNATNATATMADLTDLTITLVAGRKYRFKMILFVNDSTAAEGAKFDFDGGTATMTSFRAHGTLFDTALLLSTQTSALATDFAQATVTGDAMLEIHGAMVVDAGGTFIPRFAQNSHVLGTLTAYLNSVLVIEESSN